MLWQTTEGSFGSVTHRLGGMLFSLWVFHLFILELWRLKRAQTFFLFLTGEEKKLKRRNLPFFVPLVCTVCWLNISCTNCWFLKNVFWGRGTRKEEKEEKGETLKREESWWTHKLVYNFKILQQLTLECISTSPLLLIRFFKPEELITYLCEVPYAMRPFRISSFRHSPRNQQ